MGCFNPLWPHWDHTHLQGLADLLHAQRVLDELDTELEGKWGESEQSRDQVLSSPFMMTLSIP